jgi:hypothetical protein
LSRPHQSLNGSTNCSSCHKFGGQAALKCLDCHTEIGTRLASRKGLHAIYNIPPGSGQGGSPPNEFLKKIGVGFGSRDMTLEASKEAKHAAASLRQLAQAAAPAR